MTEFEKAVIKFYNDSKGKERDEIDLLICAKGLFCIAKKEVFDSLSALID